MTDRGSERARLRRLQGRSPRPLEDLLIEGPCRRCGQDPARAEDDDRPRVVCPHCGGLLVETWLDHPRVNVGRYVETAIDACSAPTLPQRKEQRRVRAIAARAVDFNIAYFDRDIVEVSFVSLRHLFGMVDAHWRLRGGFGLLVAHDEDRMIATLALHRGAAPTFAISEWVKNTIRPTCRVRILDGALNAVTFARSRSWTRLRTEVFVPQPIDASARHGPPQDGLPVLPATREVLLEMFRELRGHDIGAASGLADELLLAGFTHRHNAPPQLRSRIEVAEQMVAALGDVPTANVGRLHDDLTTLWDHLKPNSLPDTVLTAAERDAVRRAKSDQGILNSSRQRERAALLAMGFGRTEVAAISCGVSPPAIDDVRHKIEQQLTAQWAAQLRRRWSLPDTGGLKRYKFVEYGVRRYFGRPPRDEAFRAFNNQVGRTR